MSMSFSINIDTDNTIPVVTVQGELDIYTCPQLRKTLTDIIDKGTRKFILNLDKVNYIDSTGLGTIAHSARSIENESGNIFIICSKHQVKKIFEISGLEKKNIQLFDNEESIIQKLDSNHE